MSLGDIPLHPLVVHAAVVLAPLGALAALVFAVVPRWRWVARWPALVGADLAAVCVVAAVVTGNAFLAERPSLEPYVQQHREYGTALMWVVIPFALAVTVAVRTLAVRSPLPGGREVLGHGRLVETGVVLVVSVLAVVVLGLVVLTGHAGAEAVWGSSGG